MRALLRTVSEAATTATAAATRPQRRPPTVGRSVDLDRVDLDILREGNGQKQLGITVALEIASQAAVKQADCAVLVALVQALCLLLVDEHLQRRLDSARST